MGFGFANGKHPSLDDPNAWVPYRYVPSRPAAVIFVALFSLTTAFHIFQLVRKRTWYFIPLVIGGLFEFTGYIGRILSHKDIWALGPFIMQSLLLLVAPALFAASIYIILGRIILLVNGERYSLIRQRRLTMVFVMGDILSFLVQSGGGGIQAAGTVTSMHTGQKLILVGLFLQLAFFGFFVFVAGIFHHNLVNDRPTKQLSLLCCRKGRGRRLTSSSSDPATATPPSTSHININDLPWKRHIYTLYIASTLILVRSVFRVVEYIQGNDGYLMKHEVFLYIFDAVLMLAVMVLFNWVHPSEVTEASQKWKISREGSGDLELHDTEGARVQEGKAGRAWA